LLLLLLLLLLRRRLLNLDLEFNATETIARSGCPLTAAMLTFSHTFVREIAPKVYAAYCTLARDSYCPFGLFETSCAIDTDQERATVRASFEAAERYSLASIDHHQLRLISGAALASNSILKFPLKMTSPLNGLQRSDCIFPVQAITIPGSPITHASAGDVFAPYPVSRGQCSFIPTTNGVAVGSTEAEATIRATMELLERDAIMRFWYLGDEQKNYKIPERYISETASSYFQFLADLGYSTLGFEISVFEGAFVVLLFALHRSLQYPALACSAGASPDFPAAVRAACAELVQTLAALSLQPARFSAWIEKGRVLSHLDHHMFYYADSTNAAVAAPLLLERWKNAPISNGLENERQTTPIFQHLAEQKVEIFAANITPPQVKGEIAAIRILSPQLFPLVVGETSGPQELLASPSRVKLPHPFP
jgi:ribosomal protein S12 methylthiotransferase accessory factor YcaO